MTCARCQAEISAGARFCVACGEPICVSCPQCAGPVFGGQRSYTGCGADVAPAAAAIPAQDCERRHAPVMFSDLSGYTALNESFESEEVQALMARVKSDVSAVGERYGGTVNQFVGDEMMALFGIPVARRDDARRAVEAALELRDGQREHARRLADEGIALCRAHGMGRIGPWLHEVRALTEAEPVARSRWLEEGERQLALGCVSHNHLDLRAIAIDALLEIGDLDGVECNCVCIETYTAQDPLPMSDWIVRRDSALARVARGKRGDELAAALQAPRDEGTRAELFVLLPAFDTAIARVAAASPA